MAILRPFRAFRYSPQAGNAAKLVTQPYDKITPEMQARYLAASPYNLVRVLLGERFDSDDESQNVYTRAAAYLNDWIHKGILKQDKEAAFYVYWQEFEVPDTGERAIRKGFIGLGKVEEYSAKIVYRHEQTLHGPKKDRRQLLEHTRAHFGQIFMLYSDPAAEVDGLLNEAAEGTPLLDILDDYGARHRMWAITESAKIAWIDCLLENKKLLIADGHHRYETALAYRNEHPQDEEAKFVMMTFVNMHSPGLKILATHRVLRNLENFDVKALLKKASATWKVSEMASARQEFASAGTAEIRIGLVTPEGSWLLERARKEGELDVPVLHGEILGGLLGISEEAVREEKYIQYCRGIDAAVAEVHEKGGQAAFLLHPTPIADMARVAFGGNVMPQKSTDFYPKLLSGVTIYKL